MMTNPEQQIVASSHLGNIASPDVPSLRILHLGDDTPGWTSRHRADALARMGHMVFCVNAGKGIPKWPLAGTLGVRTGYRLWLPWINRHVLKEVATFDYDTIWVEGGPEISPGLLKTLKKRGQKVINYINDDPTGHRDGRKWDQYRKCIPEYDLVAVMREQNIREHYRLGARRVVRTYMSCDPIAHSPITMSEEESGKWASDVLFVGTYFPERGPFLLRLKELGVPLSIRGNLWERAPEWPHLRPLWKGPGIMGDDYVRAIQSSKVALGLLSKGNRDLHTRRSLEIPFIGGAAFCAERTTEHSLLYRDGEEAAFWSTPEECAERCHALLSDEPGRLRMVAAARRRVQEWRLTNDEIIAAILRVLYDQPSNHPLVKES